MNNSGNTSNMLAVSRAATAVYLILSSEGITSREVIVPANLCYAAVYPIIYSGNIPLFCDVDPVTGNTDAGLILESLERAGNKENAAAVILPHMYGKCIRKQVMDKISDICRESNILLIEDCASALGACDGEFRAGTAGDYAIYSFGYSKTVDLGGGGLIVSRRDMRPAGEMYKALDLLKEEDIANEKFFSRMYRLIRNSKDQSLGSTIWDALLPKMRNVFIHRTDDPEKDAEICRVYSGPGEYIIRRREQAGLYRSLIKWNPLITPYAYDPGDVPWRFSMFVDPSVRQDLIGHLLEVGVPVSDWYPAVTPIFGVSPVSSVGAPVFPGASYMEERILNLPLLIEDADIRTYTDIINEFFEGKT